MITREAFDGRILVLGFGSVGQCVLPAIPRHFDMPLDRILVLEAADHTAKFAPWAEQGMRYERITLTPDNLESVLAAHAGPGDLVLNLTAGVDAIAIMDWCQRHQALYVDTSLEPWAEKYEDAAAPTWSRTHYESHEVTRAHARSRWRKDGPTCIVTHGANPGIVNHFVKQALVEIAERTGLDPTPPETREGWAALAQASGTKVIHIAERDTQRSAIPREPGEFVNSWSVLGYWGEAYYPAELGWGTHEKMLPPKGQHFQYGPGHAIYLLQPGGQTLVRSWVPKGGPIHGFVISHSESVTIADYLTVWEGERPAYRPTVHYAYHPTSDAIVSLRELMMRDWTPPPATERILQDDIVEGIDELGVLLLGHGLNAYWYGSQLSIHEARKIIPGQNATAVQVCAGVISAAVWAVRNPHAGYREPDQLPYREILDIAAPYLGPVVGVASDWTPLKGRSRMFPEPWLDHEDPWQFTNFLLRS